MIEVLNLSKKYPGNDFYSCNNINLSIQKGDIVGFLGSNGAGKTTLIKMISGLIKPSSGEVKIDGSIGSDYPRKKIGVVLEGARNVYNFLTIEENLKYFGYLNKIDKYGGFTGDYLLELFDLKDKRNVEVNKLSRGMQQKVAIMIALMKNPDYLILDEPTIGLDVESKLIMKTFLKDISTKYNKTIIISSHDMDVVEAVCEKVAIFQQGKMITFESIEKLRQLHNDKVSFAATVVKDIRTSAFLNKKKDIKIDEYDEYYVCSVESLSVIEDISDRVIKIETLENDIEDIYLKLMGGANSELS